MGLSFYDSNKLDDIMSLGCDFKEYRLAHLAALRQSQCNDIKVSVNLRFWDSEIDKYTERRIDIDDKELIDKICEYIEKKYESLSEEIHRKLNPQEEE